MNCQDVQKFAFTYLDAEFDGRERGEFEAHLQLCHDCRLVVSRDAAMKDLVARHLRTERSAGDMALRAKVCEGMDRVQRRQRQRSTLVAVSVAAGVLVVSGYVLSRKPSDQNAPAVATAEPASMAAAVAQAPAQEAVVSGQGDDGDQGTADSARPAGRAHRRTTVASAMAAVVPEALPGLASAAPTRDEAGTGAAHAAMQRVAAQLPAVAGDLLAHGMRTGGTIANSALARQVQGDALTDEGSLGGVRSDDSLQQMAQWHSANLPPEVTGPPQRVQRYLGERLRGDVSLPLAQGSGVSLRGARIAALDEEAVVIYSYLADGSPLTVVSRATAPKAAAVGGTPHVQRPSGVLTDQRAGLHLVHVVGPQRVLTLVGDLSPTAMLQLLPNGGP